MIGSITLQYYLTPEEKEISVIYLHYKTTSLINWRVHSEDNCKIIVKTQSKQAIHYQAEIL